MAVSVTTQRVSRHLYRMRCCCTGDRDTCDLIKLATKTGMCKQMRRVVTEPIAA